MSVDDANRITIRLTREFWDPNVEYIAYTTTSLWPDGRLEISNLDIGNPGDEFYPIVRWSP